MENYNILVVDDEESMRLLLSGILKKAGYGVEIAADAEAALNLLRKSSYHLVISDLKMPGMSGLELLQEIRENWDEIPVVMMTAFGTIETAVEAMKDGAVDFLTKPLASPEQLRIVVQKALEKAKLERDNRILREHGPAVGYKGIVYKDPKMEALINLATKVANTDTTVLITGESGTGKEVLARMIHEAGSRGERPIVTVNCAALPENLMESEFFGHEKGAFTGATSKKIGRFELAHGNTLFLDEIGELSPSVQAKLLRVLQERTFERVGGTRPIKVDVRIIAATNRDLLRAVGERLFREDLFYRLNVFPLHIPPLRERMADVLVLADYFINKFARELGCPVPLLTSEAQALLLSYNWPGNVRELSNVIERGMILSAGGTLTAEDLAIAPVIPSGEGKEGLLQQTERQLIIHTLKENSGNRKLTAEKLGISLRSLQYKLKEYGFVE